MRIKREVNQIVTQMAPEHKASGASVAAWQLLAGQATH